MRLSRPQRRAWDWVNGEWRKCPGGLAQALYSLKLAHGDLVQFRSGLHGPRGGYVNQWRLSEEGLAAKAIDQPAREGE